MCSRKSKIGSKRIVVFSLVLLLLASPCFARASWGALLNLVKDLRTDSQSQSLVVSQESLKEALEMAEELILVENSAVEESSEMQSTQPSDKEKKEAIQALENLLKEYQKESIESEKLTDDVLISLAKLETQLTNLEKSDAITEAEYKANKDTLVALLEANAKQADRLAALEDEAGSKAYGKLYGVVGFEELSPTFGIGAGIGVRIGDSFMVEAGADYMIGNFSNPLNINWDMNKLRLTAGFGWMF